MLTWLAMSHQAHHARLEITRPKAAVWRGGGVAWPRAPWRGGRNAGRRVAFLSAGLLVFLEHTRIYRKALL